MLFILQTAAEMRWNWLMTGYKEDMDWNVTDTSSLCLGMLLQWFHWARFWFNCHYFYIRNLCLDYCNAFSMRLSLKIVWKHQLIQNTAARLLIEDDYLDLVIPLLQQLHWTSSCFFKPYWKCWSWPLKSLFSSGWDFLKDCISLYEIQMSASLEMFLEKSFVFIFFWVLLFPYFFMYWTFILHGR